MSLFEIKYKNIPSLNPSKFDNSINKLQEEIKSHQIGAIDIINKSDELELFENLSNQIKKYQKIIILGVGGSSLGAKTLCSLKKQDKVSFIESIDPSTITHQLSHIDFENSFFIVISKSGQTIETTCQTLLVIEEFKKLNSKNFSQHFLFVTENPDSTIGLIAKEINAKIVHHPSHIGGRYSVFSIVGMLPSLIAGIDIKKVRQGAKKIITDFLENDTITKDIVTQITLYEQGYTNNVLMPYVDDLENFNHWYRQLSAESLGKNGFGATPINSMGTVDQHSQLQLYLEGPKDKFFTFITQKKHPNNLLVKKLENVDTLFDNKTLQQIVKIEEETTIEVLNQKNLPIRIIEIEELNEEVLGGLMMQMFIETIALAYIKNINPFDQPAVELRKDLAKKLLRATTRSQ
ncbi:MAG: hypothetical protein ISQ34_02800 [Rickettsiales bacterium]|nr:hypothetical protein [Rickettsiales bacterium]